MRHPPRLATRILARALRHDAAATGAGRPVCRGAAARDRDRGRRAPPAGGPNSGDKYFRLFSV